MLHFTGFRALTVACLVLAAVPLHGELPAALEALRALDAGFASTRDPAPQAPPSLPPIDWSATWSADVSPTGATDPRLQTRSSPQERASPTTSPSQRIEPNFAAMQAESERYRIVAPAVCRQQPVRDKGIVTLISSNEGYPAGALAISASLEVLQSELRRIALVTPNVNSGIRELLRTAAWEVQEVPAIECNQILGPNVTPDRYDLGDEYKAKMAKWRTTCTKFHAWFARPHALMRHMSCKSEASRLADAGT